MAETGGIVSLKKVFEQDAHKPVSMKEMQEFWKSLTSEEKTDFVASAKAQGF